MVWSLTPGTAVLMSARRNVAGAWRTMCPRTRCCLVPGVWAAAARSAKTGTGDHLGEVAEPGPWVGGAFVPATGGVQERLVVGVSGFGDGLFEAHVAADGVPVLSEHGAGEQAGYSSVSVLKGVDNEKVEDEQPDRSTGWCLPADTTRW